MSGVWVARVGNKSILYWIGAILIMATTGELRAIVQELHLVDIGDAASYLGEEALVAEELPVPAQPVLVPVTDNAHFATCDGLSCQVAHV